MTPTADPPEPPKVDPKPETKPPGGSGTARPEDERGAAVIDFQEASDRIRRKGPHRQMFENLWMLLTFFLAAFMGYLIGVGMQVIGRNMVAGWET